MRLKGYDHWLDPPDDPPDGYCRKHGAYNGDECWACEQDIEAYEDERRDRHRDNPEDNYVA